MSDDTGSRARTATICAVAGSATALVAIALAAVDGPPYLSLSDLSPWLVVFAIGLFGALFAAPFAIHAALAGPLEDDARWERALLWWGAASLAIALAGILLGLPSGFSTGSLAGSVAIVIVAEAALVLATLGAWLLSG